MNVIPAPLRTARLTLAPLTVPAARSILDGDLGGLRAAPGWPQADTASGLTMAVQGGYPPGWLIIAGDMVIGDIGVHGPVGPSGAVEIGYGLAAASRGQGYGTEAVVAVTEWLLRLPQVRHVLASTLLDNAPSRRVLEKAGFRLIGADNEEASYERAADEVSAGKAE